MNRLTIRAEAEGDYAAIRQVNEEAFGGVDEADLVESLRAEGVVLLSLVAQVGDTIAGHILVSRMWIETLTGAIDAVALAPIAVARRYQPPRRLSTCRLLERTSTIARKPVPTWSVHGSRAHTVGARRGSRASQVSWHVWALRE